MTGLCDAQHWVYMMTCDEYEALHLAQDGKCGVCGIDEENTTARQLKIDHEHDGPTGYWSVRGLLCGSCNGSLRRHGTAPSTPAVENYLANAWWLALPPVMDEPPEGTVLRGRWGGRYERLADHWIGPKREGLAWRQVVWSVGPYLRLHRDPDGKFYDAPILPKAPQASHRLPGATDVDRSSRGAGAYDTVGAHCRGSSPPSSTWSPA